MLNKSPERRTSLWDRALGGGGGAQERRFNTTSDPIYENARAKFQSVVRRVNMAQTALRMLPSTSSVVRRRSAGRRLSDDVHAELRAAVARVVSQYQPTPAVLACLSPPPPAPHVLTSKARRSSASSDTTSDSTTMANVFAECRRVSPVRERGTLEHAQRSLRIWTYVSSYECAHCHEKNAYLSLCGNCRRAAYCSKECQMAHWQEHKSDCKQFNRTHFSKTVRNSVAWYIDILDSLAPSTADETSPLHMLSYLVDSFRVRCQDEADIIGQLPIREEVVPKFTRYLFAARGVRLLPDAFNKYDYACARSEASSRYNIRDIADGVGVTNVEERYNIPYDEAITRLRRLHTAICGPTLIGGVINLI